MENEDAVVIYRRPTGVVLGKLLDEYVIKVESLIKDKLFDQIKPLGFPDCEGRIMTTETQIREFVDYEDYIQKILQLCQYIPSEFRPYNSDDDEWTSAVARCVERNKQKSLLAMCQYGKDMKIPVHRLYLLGKYLPVNQHTYDIAKSFGYRDLLYEGCEDDTSIDMSKYVGYRISYHTFYYLHQHVKSSSIFSRSHVNQMLNYWLRMKYQNCTTHAVINLHRVEPFVAFTYNDFYEPVKKDPSQLSSIFGLLSDLKSAGFSEGNLSVQEFETKYWNKNNASIGMYLF